MTKAKEIFIFIAIIVIGLILIWFLVGCKDKSEAEESKSTINLAPYSVTPSIEGSVWLDNKIPPSTIFYRDGDKVIEYIPKPEPNESEYILNIPDILENIMKHIPTWPDYIELEKTLIIGHEEYTNPNGSKTIFHGIEIGKGTKIYFKE